MKLWIVEPRGKQKVEKINRPRDRGSPLSRLSGVDGPVSSSLGCLGAIQCFRGSYSASRRKCLWQRDPVGGRWASNGCVSCRLHPKYLHPMRLIAQWKTDSPTPRPSLVFPSFPSFHGHLACHIDRPHPPPVSSSLYTTATKTRRQQRERQSHPQQYRQRRRLPNHRPSPCRRATQEAQ